MKKWISIIFSYLFSFFVLIDCSSKSDRLDFALEFAGDNKGELEKVLTHYKDSLYKYEAALFLIENMPNYFSYTSPKLDSAYKIIADVSIGREVEYNTRMQWRYFNYRGLERKYDSHHITSDFLINHIDFSFEVWNKQPWSKRYSFADFCNLVLPYRIGDEPINKPWKQLYYERYMPILDSLYQGSDIVVAADSLASFVKKERFRYNLDFTTPQLEPNFLFHNRLGSCRENTNFATYLLRSLGFPVTEDIYYYSPANQFGHTWSALKDTTGLFVPFFLLETKVKRDTNDGRKRGKVYRKSFANQIERYHNLYTDEDVHPRFKTPLLIDVTSEYSGLNINHIEIEVDKNRGFVHLGLFSLNVWIPVDVSRYHNGIASVKDIEPNIIFQPLLYKNNRLQEAGYAFMLRDSVIHYFRPDIDSKLKAKLTRKYPLGKHITNYLSRVVGSRIEIANRADFKGAQILHVVDKEPCTNYNVVDFPNMKKFRYARYTSHQDKPLEIAELSFFSSINLEDKLLPKKIIAGSETRGPKTIVEMINDNDWLTYTSMAQNESSITFDFGEPVKIVKLMYMPRNDDNFVRVGDRYELFYQNGSDGWRSLGEKIAETSELLYDNIPQNALLWLHNISRGREEQVFYICEDKQMFVGTPVNY